MKTYRIYDPQGALLAEGAISQCAKRLGLSESALRYAASKEGYTKLIFEETTVPKAKIMTEEMAAACASWEAFCEPLRKKYGIAVRRQS